jgi:hypothetical protein
MQISIHKHLALHYGLTIFLSAFLLFQVQPVIGKMILPWFGGSAAVWTTCMLFFQMLLLLGYAYAHFLMQLRSSTVASYLHIALLAISLIFLPLTANTALRPIGNEDPTLRILLLLGASIGLPYFVLSSTGPLIQAWFSREQRDAVPYRLFALSNFGSLLALLAYPALVEPHMPVKWQSWCWSALFVCFVLSCAALAWRARSLPAAHQVHGELPPVASARKHLLWIALAACPSVMMLAVTSFITENVAPVPLLWVLPLALYLVSFILCFEGKAWYRRAVFLPLLAVSLAAMAYVPGTAIGKLPILLTMAIELASFFVICMFCHGELAGLRPHASRLTGYYLMLAIGGVCGGLFVGLVAPYCFNSNYEYSIGLLATAVIAAIVAIRLHVPQRYRMLVSVLAALLIVKLGYVRVSDHLTDLRTARLMVRDFYGVQAVFQNGEGDSAVRVLMHGQIIHGMQASAPASSHIPLTYYGTDSGVGRVLQTRGATGPLRVGLVGLGAGTLAAYGRAGDDYQFYEIDPKVVDIASTQFSYLANNPAHGEIHLGDARLTLDRQPSQQFDVLVVDAFSGDSVPAHLLTREAFAIYFRHLKADGILAMHVSNRFLDLAPVVKSGAESFGKTVRIVNRPADASGAIFKSSWIVISTDDKFFDNPAFAGIAQPIAAPPGFRMWTDDYSSIFAALK